MTPKDLGPLEFKAEDFGSIKMEMTNGRITTDIVRLDEVITLANRLLAERLEKAPEVWGKSADADLWGRFDARPRDTHRARLVCIEEIKK